MSSCPLPFASAAPAYIRLQGTLARPPSSHGGQTYFLISYFVVFSSTRLKPVSVLQLYSCCIPLSAVLVLRRRYHYSYPPNRVNFLRLCLPCNRTSQSNSEIPSRSGSPSPDAATGNAPVLLSWLPDIAPAVSAGICLSLHSPAALALPNSCSWRRPCPFH